MPPGGTSNWAAEWGGIRPLLPRTRPFGGRVLPAQLDRLGPGQPPCARVCACVRARAVPRVRVRACVRLGRRPAVHV